MTPRRQPVEAELGVALPHESPLDRFRRAVSDDPAKLGRLEDNLERVNTTPGVPDDLNEIERLLLTAE